MNIIEAKEVLKWAEKQNPGPWVLHSENVGKAAAKMASLTGLDEEKAAVYGLLHDIGRYKGPSAMMHIYDGYKFCLDRGENELAQICLTHSFPISNIDYYSGANDCSEDIYDEIRDYLNGCKYSDYDYLIVLCDSIALPEGVCLLEKRLVDVAMRHGIKDNTLKKWEKIFEIKNYFEDKMSKSIYEVFPESVEVTFI